MTQPTTTWTIGQLLQWTQNYLRDHGVENPRLDAEVLLAKARGCQRIELYTSFGEEASAEVRQAFRELVKRRAAGEPVAYLVGQREFFSLPFRVTPEVLIPRPETEFVLMALLDLAKAAAGRGLTSPRIADIGTGSGVLAVCAAKHLPRAQVTAVDLSAEALRVARSNAAHLGMADRITFLQGDLFAPVPASQQFDFVVSNPPYVRSDEFPSLPREVRDHEPRQALEAGPTGTEVIARLVPQAAQRLVGGGYLLLEIGPGIAENALRLLADEPRLEPQPIGKDLAGLPRVLTARRREEASPAP